MVLQLKQGEAVFAAFEEDLTRFYAATILGHLSSRQNAYQIEWGENHATATVLEKHLLLPAKVLKKGLEISTIVPEKLNFYEDVVFEYMDGVSQIFCKFPDGTVRNVPFDNLMVEAVCINTWRKKQKDAGKDPDAEFFRPLPVDGEPVPKVLVGWNFLMTASKNARHRLQRAPLSEWIIQMGGEIYHSFGMFVDAPGERCLLSSSYSRTCRYIQCLSAGIPCVSPRWIRDMYVMKAFTDYHPHLLPAGILEVDGVRTLVKRKGEGCFLPDMKIGLHGATAFLDVYYELLKAAQAVPVAVENKHFRSVRKLRRFSVIVVESTSVELFDKLLETCTKAEVPLVDQSWVVQSAINGAVLPYASFLFKSSTKSDFPIAGDTP